MVTTGQRDGEGVGQDAYREIKYEDLLAEPERELRLLSLFLDLPYSEDMAASHHGKTKNNPKLAAKSAWLPATPGLRDWKSQMDERDAELFEALAGPLLTELGYNTSGGSPSPGSSNAPHGAVSLGRGKRNSVAAAGQSFSARSFLAALATRSVIAFVAAQRPSIFDSAEILK